VQFLDIQRLGGPASKVSTGVRSPCERRMVVAYGEIHVVSILCIVQKRGGSVETESQVNSDVHSGSPWSGSALVVVPSVSISIIYRHQNLSCCFYFGIQFILDAMSPGCQPFDRGC
jgi:hypothetical protein